MKNLRITLRTFVFAGFCTPLGEHVPGNQELERKPKSKAVADKSPNRAFDRARDFFFKASD